MARWLGVVWATLALAAMACGGDNSTADDDDGPTSTRCGDNTCSDNESVITCPADCPAMCGDNACTHQETAAICADDCPAMCGDDACTAPETVASCPADCATICGDTLCSFGEAAAACPVDCSPGCGDGACTHSENVATCASDCPSVCGDDLCSDDEDCGDCSIDCGVCLPATVNITLVGALIRPALFDGRTWDGPDLSPSQTSELAELLANLAGHPELSEVAGLLGGLAINAWSPPDPFGFAELAWNGPFDPNSVRALGSLDTNIEDTFTPQWPGPPFPQWESVPTSPGLRVRITLQDEDLANDDVIGTVDLNEADLRAVYNAGRTTGVLVHGQGVGHILYAIVSVTASELTPCNGECASNTYSACTCAASDPCGWLSDGTCDSFCTANFPLNHFRDVADCAAACVSDCASLTYSACSCSSVDPCNWQGDGTCDVVCAQAFPDDHFHDPADCP